MQTIEDSKGIHVLLNSYEREILLNSVDREEILKILIPLDFQYQRKEILAILSQNHIDNWTYQKLRKYLGRNKGLTKRQKRLLESLKNQILRDPEFISQVSKCLGLQSKENVGTTTNRVEDRKLLQKIKKYN